MLLVCVLVSAHYCTTPASSVEDKGASVYYYYAHYSALASADIFWYMRLRTLCSLYGWQRLGSIKLQLSPDWPVKGQFNLML